MQTRPSLSFVWFLLLAVAAAAPRLAAQATGTALVRHAPSLNGTVDGSVQQMNPGSVTLNGSAVVTGDLLVPGTPNVVLNGNPTYGGTQNGAGAASPTSYQVTLNGNARLRHVIRRTDAIALPSVSAPPQPAGTRTVNINSAGQSAGDYATLRNLTLNGNVGQYAIPPGTYGDFTANGGSGFTLGVAGATQPAVYNFQRLTLNGQTQFNVVGPVAITVANGFNANGQMGSAQNPAWLALKVYSGAFTLNGGCAFHGFVTAPNSTVTVNGNSQLVGGLVSDRLTVNGNGLLRLASVAANAPPAVALTAPVNNAVADAPATFLLQATASDSDGTVAKVEFFQGATLLATDTAAPYEFSWTAVPAGTHALTAKATDNAGATATSAVVTVIANARPVVALTAPANHAVSPAPGNFLLQAAATDADGTIAKVQYYAGPTLLGESTSTPHQFAWSNVSAGTYAVTAVATDNRGSTGTSSAVTLIVDVRPTVALTSPTAGASFTAPATVALAANAADADGTVAKVEFFNGATLLATVTSPPYQFTWANVGVGAHSLTAVATDNHGVATTSTAVAITVNAPNAVPAVALTAPAHNALFAAPASFTLAATASDTDGTIAKVEFFRGTTLLGEDTAAPYEFAVTGLAAGTYDFTARAIDNAGTPATSAAVTVISNAPPTLVALTQPTAGAVFPVPGPILLEANASDTDGTIAKVEFLTGDTVIGEDTTAPYQFTWTNVPGGAHPLSVRAIDDRGTATTSATVAIVVDHLPTVALTSPTAGQVIDVTTPVLFAATVNDADGTVTKVEFRSGPTLLGEATAAPWQFTWNTTQAGPHTVFARAYDNHGLFKDSSEVTFTLNVPPVVQITAPVSGSVYDPPAAFQLAADATDSDGAIGVVEFYRNDTKIGEATVAPYTFAVSGLGTGTHVFKAKAVDNHNSAVTSASVTVTVNAPNQPPVVALTAPSEGAVFAAPATFELTATASDSDGTIAKVEFLHGTTVIGEDTTAPYAFTWANRPAGTYALAARAIDDDGASATSAAVNVIANGLPTVALTAPASGATFEAPATFALTAEAADSDGTVALVEFFRDGTKVGEDAAVPYAFAVTGLGTGTHAFTAKATDNRHGSLTSTAVTVVVNAPNQPPVVALTAPAAGTVLAAPATFELAANASDPDGTIAKVEFLHGTTVIGEDTTAPYTFTWPDRPAGSYALAARATDNRGAVTTSAAVTVGSNPLPVVALTAPANNAIVAVGAALTLTATATDDGTIARVEFFRAGTTSLGTGTAGAGNTFTLTLASGLPGGVHALTAKATDDHGAVVTSAPVAVRSNTPPVAATQSLATSGNTPLAITLTATDAENDTVTFAIVTPPTNGTLSALSGAITTYTPANGYGGPDSFTFKANDGLDSNVATISITVGPPNDPPLVNAGPDKAIKFTPSSGGTVRGRIVVNNDEWALTDEGFNASPFAGAFTRNLADYLTGGKPGAKFLAYTNTLPGTVDFIYKGTRVAQAMAAAGHTWTVSSTIAMTLENLRQYDAVFLGASSVDNLVLIDYVNGGGSVYLSAGTHWCGCNADVEASWWNTFLNHFNLTYLAPYNGVGGTLPIASDHPLFHGITSLFFANGNSVAKLNPDDQHSEIPFVYNGHGMFGLAGDIVNQLFVHGTVTDDGRPTPPTLTYVWTQVSGPPGVTFDAPNSLTTRVRLPASGSYTLRLTASDGSKTGSDDVMVFANMAPTVFAGPDQILRDTTQVATLNGTAQDDGVPNGVLTYRWEAVTGPGTVNWSAQNAQDTTATFTAPGIYTLELTASDSLVSASDRMEVRVGMQSLEPPAGIVAWFPLNHSPYEVISGVHQFAYPADGYAAGKVGGAASFSGQRYTALAKAHPDFDVGTSAAGFSLEFWIRSTSSAPTAIGWANGTNFYLKDGNRLAGNFREANGTNHDFDSHAWDGGGFKTLWVHDGGWHHFIIAYDRTTGVARFFQNGLWKHDQNWGSFAIASAGNFQLGSFGFSGLIDEVTLYRRPLGFAEAAALFAAGANGKATPDNNAPPVVDAGPNLAVPDVATPALLAANVTEDDRPFGPPSIAWAKIEGPGTVDWGDQHARQTSATFTAPGVYQLKITVDDHYNVPVSDIVEVRVGGGFLEPPSGLVAWWPGNGEAKELVRGHDLLLVNNVGYTPGTVLQAFNFPGGGNFAYFPPHADLDLGASPAGFSFEFWVNSTSGAPLMFGWGGSSGMTFHLQDGNRFAGNFREANGINHAFDSHSLGGDVMWTHSQPWNHIAVAYDRPAGVMKLYLNGKLHHTVNYGNLRFGTQGDFYLGNPNWIGKLDEAALYNRPLSFAEVSAIFQAGLRGKSPPDDNLPPTVLAGPDFFVPGPGSSVTLAGSAPDDNKPFGLPVTTWSQADGPGTSVANLATPGSLTSNVTFPTNGIYLLRLSATDRLTQTVSDFVEARVGAGYVEPPAGIAAWWPGNGSPAEIINGNHDIELLNGATYQQGRVSQGFRFPGGTSYGRILKHADLDIATSAAGFTFEVWVNSTSGVHMLGWNGGMSFHLQDGNRFAGNFRELSGTNHQFDSHALGGNIMWTHSQTWNHIVVAYDRPAGVVRMFLNGHLHQTINYGNLTFDTSGDLILGSPAGWNGTLDELTLYRRPLAPAEVATLYAAGGLGKAPPDNNVPPVVSAGPDAVVASAPGSATLQGSFLDDNRPHGAPTVVWSQADGPTPQAQFAHGNQAQTTATFSVPGLYLLKLTVSDGYSPAAEDYVEVRVGSGAASVPSAVAAWWPGNLSPQEVINGNHDVELLNGATYAAGRVSQGFRLPGGTSYARVAKHAHLDIATSTAGFTFELWVSSTSGVTHMLGWNGGMSFYLHDGNRFAGNFRELNGTNHQFDSHALGGNIMWTHSQTWNHLAIAYDRPAGLMRMYLNGALHQTINYGNLTFDTSGDLILGSPAGWNGTLDEITLYRRPLTGAEIAAIHGAGTLGKQPAVNLAPVAQAGPDQSTLLGTPVTLAGSATDDGLPAAGTLTYLWSKTSGPGGVTFGSATSASTTASFTAAGAYVLRLTASDSQLNGFDEMAVTVTSQPPAIAFTAPANNATLPANTFFELVANATDPDTPIAKVEFFQGATLLGTQTGPEVGNPNSYFWPMTGGLPAGSYTFTAKATDTSGASTTSAPRTITVIADPGPPVASIATPTLDAIVTQPTPVTGAASSPLLASWKLQQRLKAAEGEPVGPWITFATDTVSKGTEASPVELAKFDPTSLLNGVYEITLVVTDTAGRESTLVQPVTIAVEGNMKTGAFSLAFEDLKIPVAGIPIAITRTYDSRDPRVGDFGPGWRLAVNSIRLQKSRDLHAFWFQPLQQGTGLQMYPVDPTRPHTITVVMPEGRIYRFRAGVYVDPSHRRPQDPENVGFPAPVDEAKMRFYSEGSAVGKLEPLDSNNELFEEIWLDNTGNTSISTDATATEDYNPRRFRLTTEDGSRYIIDEALGLLEVRDPNGNTLVLNRDAQDRVSGVTTTQLAASGSIVRHVSIHRDATGRVDYIRDLANQDLDYLYDPQGRLTSLTNRANETTQFRYENAAFPNYLTRIVDPRGVAALRTEYDPVTGKLVKQIDADGKETVFTHGLADSEATRFEKVKDRWGKETTFFFDQRGNVTKKIDPLLAETTYGYYPDTDRLRHEIDHYGNVKSRAYDAQGNVTVETIGANVAENPAAPLTGYVTRTTYNDRGDPTQTTDPSGRVQTFAYHATTGSLISHTVGSGGAMPASVTYTYYDDGTVNTMTDALGNVTGHAYDYAFSDGAYPTASKKAVVTVMDPAGAAGSDPNNPTATTLRSTQMLFDAQENQVAQIVARTLPDGTSENVVTRYLHDAERRLIAVISPDGRVIETRYTPLGREAQSVLWQSTADYQSRDDSRARITSYGYDARGNQTTVAHPDGTSEVVHYDLENRKDWMQDARGYRTFFTYDDVGRPKLTIHPDANDGIGAAAPNSVSDPRLGDNPKTEVGYDLVGRVTETFDELRNRTRTTYFADGSPSAGRRKESIVVRAAGDLVTSYQYDEAGNTRFVTDPRGNTVETRYDDHGRPRLVVYPATDEHPSTQTEIKYDAMGRRVEVVDQENKVTRSRYDGLGRLVEMRQYLDQSLAAADAAFSLSPSASGVVSTRYSYDALGNQQTQVDSLGRVTTYWTDMVGRRTQRILPKDATESSFLTELRQYDGWGNLWKRTDFSGKVTTFSYDLLNRLKSKAADPTHPSLVHTHAIARVEYDYDAGGARTAARTFNAGSLQLYAEATPRDARGRLDEKDVLGGGKLDYGYHANGQLSGVAWNAGAQQIGYRYDEANRLAFVDDATTGTIRTTSYAYNANGVLAGVTQPNAVVHSYGYDALNRLRTLNVTQGPTIVHAYEYRRTPSGHRHQVLEGQKTTTYAYDALYRLTSESISGDPAGNNGTVGYGLDKVGNRENRTSSVGAVPAILNGSYNARDWRSGETYSANGSVLTSAALPAAVAPAAPDVYDFEERLILRSRSDGSTVGVSYDADGLRFAKQIRNGAAQLVSETRWLVDANNLTGYAQVVEERITTSSDTTLRLYVYGSDLISQGVSVNGQPLTQHCFTYDGHGSTRALTDVNGTVTDRFDYDAFGLLIRRTGTTPVSYLYCGEQFDSDLGLYYLRARYLNAESGRFWSMDSYEGSGGDPMSLHKYAYAHGNPVFGTDPSGHLTLAEIGMAVLTIGITAAIAQPIVESAVGRAFSALGFTPEASISLSSLGRTSDAGALIEAFGIPADSLKNVFVQAAQHLVTDAIVGKVAGVATAYVLRAYAKAKAAKLSATVKQGKKDFTDELGISEELARKHLRKSVGGANGGQVHHIIPWEMRSHPLVAKAAQSGFNINGASNAIRLELTQHLGSHPKYSEAVRRKLDSLHELMPNATPFEAQVLVQNYADQLGLGLLGSWAKLK